MIIYEKQSKLCTELLEAGKEIMYMRGCALTIDDISIPIVLIGIVIALLYSAYKISKSGV